MRVVSLLGPFLVAAGVLCVLTAPSAFGLTFESSEFTVKGSPAETQTALSEGELLLEDEGAGAAVVCSVALNEHFEEPGGLLATEVSDLGGKKFTGELTGEGILCKAESACTENTDLQVWPLDLPWLFIAELDTETGAAYVFAFEEGKGLPGYEVQCLILGISTEDTCTFAEGSGNEVLNAAGGVETSSGVTIEPKGNCTVGGAGKSVVTAFTAGLLSSESGLVQIGGKPALVGINPKKTAVLLTTGFSETIKYIKNKGPEKTEGLTVVVNGTGFANGAGTTCTVISDLKDKGTCLVSITCTTDGKNDGEVTVTAKAAGIDPFTRKKLECL